MYSDAVPPGVYPPVEGGPVAGPLEGLLDLPAGKVAAFSGPEGSGKTSLAQVTLPDAFLVGEEMFHDDYLRNGRALGVPWQGHGRSRWTEDGELEDLGIPEDRQSGDVIVDSVSVMRDGLQYVERLIDLLEHTGGRAIVILHQTTKGTAWGGKAIPHRVHATVEVSRDELDQVTARLLKQRGGATGQRTFRLHDRGKAVPAVYVTVERARGGGYRLLAFPSDESRRASDDVYRAAEQLGYPLPPPPLAVSARRSVLYPSGWTEPADADRRRAHADQAGVPYWSPLDDPTFLAACAELEDDAR